MSETNNSENQSQEKQTSEDKSTEQGEAIVSPDETPRFSQKQVDDYLARERKKWERNNKRQGAEPGKSDAAPKEQSASTELAEIRQLYQLTKYQTWLARKPPLDPRGESALEKLVDLSNPDTWDSTFEQYKELFAPREKQDTNQKTNPPNAMKGAPQGQQRKADPTDLTSSEIKSLKRDELEKLARQKFDAFFGGNPNKE